MTATHTGTARHLSRAAGQSKAHQMSSSVLSLVTAHHLSHLVLQVKLQFLKLDLSYLFIICESVLRFQFLKFMIVFGMLLGQLAEMLVGRHQVRFQIILRRILHAGLSPSLKVLCPSQASWSARDN